MPRRRAPRPSFPCLVFPLLTNMNDSESSTVENIDEENWDQTFAPCFRRVLGYDVRGVFSQSRDVTCACRIQRGMAHDGR